MSFMPTTKALLALVVSASLAAPAGAQVRAAAQFEGALAPRVALSAPLSAPSVLMSAPLLSISAAPSLSAAPAFAAALPAAVGVSAAAVAPEAAVPSAVVPAAAAPAASVEALAAAQPTVAAVSSIVGAPAAGAPASSVESGRSRWESFWSGSAAREGKGVVALSAVGAAAAPAGHGLHAVLAHAGPFTEAGAVLVGTYFVNRGVHSLLNKFAAKKDLDRHQVAAIRLVSDVALWTGAAAGALTVGGASPATLAAVFGAGGTIVTLGLRDVLGNMIQGVNFLIARPFTIGEKVQIDDQVGVISDATLTTIVVKKDDGSEVKIRHSTLAAKPVIIFGKYQPDAKLHLGVPVKPKFQGVLGAVWKSFDRRFWIAGAAFAALLAVPPFVPVLAAGWIAAGLHYALAGSTLWLTRRVDLALNAAVDQLASENGWRKETAVITRLAVSAALWSLGAGSALRMVGVSWTALGASVGVTTLGIGLASNNFFSSVVQGGEVLFSKPFKVGDHVKIGAFEGLVEDMTLNHVVVKLDEGRHALVPYAVVRDATLVVTPGK
jgi:small-conductance mechanosensitive channel